MKLLDDALTLILVLFRHPFSKYQSISFFQSVLLIFQEHEDVKEGRKAVGDIPIRCIANENFVRVTSFTPIDSEHAITSTVFMKKNAKDKSACKSVFLNLDELKELRKKGFEISSELYRTIDDDA